MSSRGSVYLLDSLEPRRGIYLHTSFEGYSLPEKVRLALQWGRSQWEDTPFLFRIIISRLFSADHGSEVGSAVSTFPVPGGSIIVIVDGARKHVAFAKERDEVFRDRWWGQMSFNSYVSLTHATVPAEPASLPPRLQTGRRAAPKPERAGYIRTIER